MKLIENISDGKSFFTYFPEIDYIDKYTEKDPAIFHKIYYKNDECYYIYLPKFINVSEEPKYLFIKLDAEIKYTVYIDQNNNNNYSCKLIAFDYLSCKKTDIENNKNYFLNKDIGIIYQNYQYVNKKIDLYFNEPIILLIKIYAINNYSTNKEVKLCFSNPPLSFDYTGHYMRYWQKKINGTSWDFTGKLNNYLNLKSINKDKKYDIKKNYWKEGLLYYVLPIENYELFDTIENAYNKFNNISPSDYQYLNNLNINNSFQGYTFNFIVHIKFDLYSTSNYFSSYINVSGKIFMKIDERIYIYENSNNYGDFYLNENQNYHEIQIFYIVKDENPRLLISNLNSNNIIAKNEYNADKYIPLTSVFSNLSEHILYNEIVNMKNHEKIEVNCNNIQDNCTISFWIKINEMPEEEQIPIIKGKDNNLLSISITDQLLKITERNNNSEFNIELQKNKWYHICLVMSKSIITYYINFFDVYYYKSSFYHYYDNNYDIGHDINENPEPDYDIFNFMVFNEAKNQNQVNKLYLNWRS